jgi:hypothetical protein
MSSLPGAWRRRLTLLSREPTVYFFAVGALLFVAHRLLVGDPRVIVVTPGVKAEVARRFRDNNGGRSPSPSELDHDLRTWERDEALYREALREGLDRHDGTIRTVLADRVRGRAAVGIAQRVPSAADLEGWLATHRSLYETPRRYDYETVAFPKAGPLASAERERYARALKAGTDPTTLGRPIVGGNLTADDLKERLGVDLAARIQSLPVGRWQRLESEKELMLARLNAVGGGLPSVDEVRQRLVVDWRFAERQREVEQAVQAVVDRYRVEERPSR